MTPTVRHQALTLMLRDHHANFDFEIDPATIASHRVTASTRIVFLKLKDGTVLFAPIKGQTVEQAKKAVKDAIQAAKATNQL